MAILAFLLKFRYCFQSQIKQAFFQGKTDQACSKVLRKLNQLRLISMEYTPRTFHHNLGNLVFLTERGGRLLAEEQKTTLFELGYRKVSCKPRSNSFLWHRKKIIDTHIQISSELEQLPINLNYLAREDERVKRTFGETVITTLFSQDHSIKITPDMVFVLESQVTQSQAVFVVEIDTGSETVGMGKKHEKGQSILDKFQRYERLLVDPYRGWKEHLPETSADGFQVLTITNSDRRIESMRSLSKHLQALAFFKFSTFDRLDAFPFFRGHSWKSFHGSDYGMLI